MSVSLTGNYRNPTATLKCESLVANKGVNLITPNTLIFNNGTRNITLSNANDYNAYVCSMEFSPNVLVEGTPQSIVLTLQGVERSPITDKTEFKMSIISVNSTTPSTYIPISTQLNNVNAGARVNSVLTILFANNSATQYEGSVLFIIERVYRTTN